MSQNPYTDTVMDHFMNPRNVGDMEDADGIGESGNPVCGDMMRLYVKIDGDRIADVKYRPWMRSCEASEVCHGDFKVRRFEHKSDE
jgi:hypothetical protein